jgi:predicted DsbA family dithiol-disulfide isomerase
MVKLDILSDPACPWCMIGKVRLDRALANRPDHPFEIEWHPYQLSPDTPAEGLDRPAWLEARFGGADEARQSQERVDAAARESGIEIDWDSITRVPNTLDAHRLIHWAALEGRQPEVVDALFHAYWHEGRDIGDRDQLADIADGAGMDAALVRRLLATDADADDIRAREAHARERGVRGVPTFIIAGRHVVGGAQMPELWEQLVDEILAQLST